MTLKGCSVRNHNKPYFSSTPLSLRWLQGMESPEAAAMQADGQPKSAPRLGTCWCFKRRSSHPGTFPKHHQLQVPVHQTSPAEQSKRWTACVPTPLQWLPAAFQDLISWKQDLKPSLFPLDTQPVTKRKYPWRQQEKETSVDVRSASQTHHKLWYAEHKQEVDAHVSSGDSVNIWLVLCN